MVKNKAERPFKPYLGLNKSHQIYMKECEFNI